MTVCECVTPTKIKGYDYTRVGHYWGSDIYARTDCPKCRGVGFIGSNSSQRTVALRNEDGGMSITPASVPVPEIKIETQATGGRSHKFYALLGEIRDLHDRKNSGYAGKSTDPFANFRECEDFGIPAWKGVLTRMSDKWMRIKNLAGGIEDKVGESIIDTVTDLAVYSLICRILIEEAKNE